MLIVQWYCNGIFGVLKDMDVDPVLALLAIVRVAEADWNARPDLDWFLYTLDEM